MSINKQTSNYSKCNYMIISKRDIDTSLFTSKINNLNIEHADCSQYLAVLLDDKLSWKYHLKLRKKAFENMWLIFNLRCYVPLSTYKLVYYFSFNHLFCIFFNQLRKSNYKSCLR